MKKQVFKGLLVMLVLLVAVVMLNGSGVLVKEKEVKKNTQKKIEIETIWEKQFDEPVVDVIFGETEVTVKEAKRRGWKNLEGKKDNEKVKIEYLKVKLIPERIDFRKKNSDIKEIKFFDKEGKIKKQIVINYKRGESVLTSSNQKYILISPGCDPILEMRNEGGTLYTNDGTEILRRKKGPSFITVSNEGNVLAGDLDYEDEGIDGSFFLYNLKGEEIKIIENPYRNERIGKGLGKFTDNGKYVILKFTNYKKSTIMLITKSGKILWEKEINFYIRDLEFDCKEDIGIVGIATNIMGDFKAYVFYIGWNGDLKWTAPLETMGGMIVKFSKDYKKVFITTHQGFLWCINIQSGKFLWEHEENWTRQRIKKIIYDVPQFSEMEIKNENIYILGKKYSKENGWHSSTLYIFAFQNGDLLQKIEYPDKRISLISHNNKIFLLDIDSRKISSIKIKEVEK